MYTGLTKAGEIYLANRLANKLPVNFLKVKIGNGTVPHGADASETTELYSFKKEIQILDITQTDNVARIRVLIDNSDVEQGFFMKELGVYVDDNGKEKLYWYVYEDNGQYVHSKTERAIQFDLELVMEVTSSNSTILDWNKDKVWISKNYFDEKVRTFEIPTIAELQSRKNLKVGDIVEVLGYYEAGDGAGHKRIIANEDDGSGVQLANKLWANIIHNGEVNVSWFGAKGDGVTDDTIAIKMAANYGCCKVFFKDKYLITDVIKLKDGTYYGNGKSEIIIDFKEYTEGCICNEHYKIWEPTEKNYNYIEIYGLNVNIKKGAFAFSFMNAQIFLHDCNFFSNGGCIFDLYGNNSNSKIVNCNFKIYVENPESKGSCFEIRGFGGHGELTTENIVISNCIFEQNCLDETIWICNRVVTFNNILIDNCIINDFGRADNTIYIGGETKNTKPIKNVIVKGCTISKTNGVDRCISVNPVVGNEGKCENILFVNNIINATGETNFKVFNYQIDNSNFSIGSYEEELVLSNNIINCNGVSPVKFICAGRMILFNNKINSRATYCLYNVSKTQGNTFKHKGTLMINTKNMSDDYIETETFFKTNTVFNCDTIVRKCEISFLKYYVIFMMITKIIN